MYLIIGLGNIGKEYEYTRHNVGFMVADELAARYNIAWKTDSLAFRAEAFSPERTIIIKPRTYMNLSGNAVRYYMEYLKIPVDNIAVVQDDLYLPCGKLRIRRKGSAGGHNGLKSIVQNIGTDDFVRFKIGIGEPEESEKTVIKHVLQNFSKEEKPLIENAVKKTADALECWQKNGIDVTMNRFNG